MPKLILADDLARPRPYPNQAEILRVKRSVRIDAETLYIVAGHCFESSDKRIGPVERGTSGTQAVEHEVWTSGTMTHVLTAAIGPATGTILMEHHYLFDSEQMVGTRKVRAQVERGGEGSVAASHSAGAVVEW